MALTDIFVSLSASGVFVIRSLMFIKCSVIISFVQIGLNMYNIAIFLSFIVN